MPGVEVAELVAAQHQDQRVVGAVVLPQGFQRVDRVAGTVAVHFLLVDLPVAGLGAGGQGGDGQAQHGQPVPSVGLVAAFLPGMAGRDQHQLVQLQGGDGRLAEGQVRHVDGIEAAAQKPDATTPAETHADATPSQSRAGRKSV